MKLLIVGSLFLSSMAFAANGEMVAFSNNQACFIGGSSQASCYCNSAGTTPYSENGATGCTTCGPGTGCTYGSKSGALKVIPQEKRRK